MKILFPTNRRYRSLSSPWRCGAILLLLVVMLLTCGCIETINFDVQRTGRTLVVDGGITNTNGPYQVRLSWTSSQEKVSDPLSGATVTISDDLGNNEHLYETEPGLYESMSLQVKGVPGRSYTLEIEVLGRTYRSEPEVMPASTAEDSIRYEFDIVEEINEYGNAFEFEIIRITRETTVPATDNPLFFRWELQETYKFSQYDYPDPFNMPPPSCYVTRYPDPQAILLYNGLELKGGPLDPEVVLEREIDGTFYQRHYFNLIQYSITQQAYKYWEEVDQVINQSGTIFDVPPANATSNIRNINDPTETVLGYFQAAAVDTSRVYTLESDLPIHIGNPCRFPNSADCERGCSIYDNVEPDLPYYWLDGQGQ